jgi:benzoyl-CoA-dihydrodiol lyase
MLALPDDPARAPAIALSPQNFGAYPMVNGRARIDARFHGARDAIGAAHAAIDRVLRAAEADALGLVTATPDELDWHDEIRIALEERASLSPDALTGLEANLRFGGAETMESRIFGRLTAWQNWIFNRPNAVGDKGALKVYGKGDKPQFDWSRV